MIPYGITIVNQKAISYGKHEFDSSIHAQYWRDMLYLQAIIHILNQERFNSRTIYLFRFIDRNNDLKVLLQLPSQVYVAKQDLILTG